MALYRCNRCGHLSEQADELIGSSQPCPSCRTDNAVYPTVRFVQSMLTRYFAARRDLTAARAEIETLRAEHPGLGAAIEPLPDPAVTRPNLVILPHRDAQATGRGTGAVMNPGEL